MLLHFAEGLLRQLCVFVPARPAQSLRLAWQYRRYVLHDVASQGELTVATADPIARPAPPGPACWPSTWPTRRLLPPAGEITLSAEHLLPQQAQNAGLLPGSHEPEERLHTHALERLSVRLGAGQVREGSACTRTTGSATCSAGTPGLRRPSPAAAQPRALPARPPAPPGWSSRPSPCAATREQPCWPGPHPHQRGRTARGRLVGGTQPAANARLFSGLPQRHARPGCGSITSACLTLSRAALAGFCMGCLREARAVCVCGSCTASAPSASCAAPRATRTGHARRGAGLRGPGPDRRMLAGRRGARTPAAAGAARSRAAGGHLARHPGSC